jgi:hypothetical protein
MNGLHTRVTLHESIHGDVPYLPNAHGLGTPDLKAERRIRWYSRIARVCVWFVALASAYIVGLNAQNHRTVTVPTPQDVRAAKFATGQRVCELDPHEGCLICLHKDALGQTVVSNHC